MVFNDFINDDLISDCDGQVASASLADPVALETEEQTLEGEQNVCQALKCPPECLSRMCL